MKFQMLGLTAALATLLSAGIGYGQGILGGAAGGNVASQLGQQSTSQAGLQSNAQVGGVSAGNALQGVLNNGIQGGVNAASNAAVQGQGIRALMQQGASGAVEGAVNGSARSNGNTDGGGDVRLNASAGSTPVTNGQAGKQLAVGNLLQGVTIGSDGALRLNGQQAQGLSQYGIQANDRIIDANGIVVTDPNQIQSAFVNTSGFRVLRNGQIVKLQGQQGISVQPASNPSLQNLSLQQKLAIIEQLVREVRDEISNSR